MTEPKHIYVESNGYNNWCSTERGHKSDVEYISVEWLKSTINEHHLQDGKTDFRSKGEKKRERQREQAKIEHEKYGKCGHCDGFLQLRLNSIRKTFFLGCENFPKCKYQKNYNHENNQQ